MNAVNDDTIIACSSGDLTAAISLIRISGTKFLEKINHLFLLDLKNIKPNNAKFTKLIFKEKVVDEIVLTYFKSPYSYNGEDILELAVHGNPVNVNRIIEVFCEIESIRKARPGEFSLRAVKNKKLTIPQVEGLDLLLNANSIFAIDQGLSVLSGDLQESFERLYEMFLRHKSSIEIGFDFLDDVGEETFKQNLKQSFKNLKKITDDLLIKIKNNNYNLINPEITLFGQPNSGKSTLFNKLLQSQRAIVSDVKGTTRDYIRENIHISGNLFSLIDTAGIRVTEDKIEKIGIESSLKLIKNSFFKILLFDPRSNLDEINQYVGNDTIFDLILYTHWDDLSQKSKEEFGSIEPQIKSAPIEPKNLDNICFTQEFHPLRFELDVKTGSIEPQIPSAPIGPEIKTAPIEPIFVINLLDENKDFIKLIYNLVISKYQKLLSFDPILINRHAETIKNIGVAFNSYEEIFEDCDDLSILASEFNTVGHCVSELIGIVSPDDVLGNIFENFCIGK